MRLSFFLCDEQKKSYGHLKNLEFFSKIENEELDLASIAVSKELVELIPTLSLSFWYDKPIVRKCQKCRLSRLVPFFKISILKIEKLPKMPEMPIKHGSRVNRARWTRIWPSFHAIVKEKIFQKFCTAFHTRDLNIYQNHFIGVLHTILSYLPIIYRWANFRIRPYIRLSNTVLG